MFFGFLAHRECIERSTDERRGMCDRIRDWIRAECEASHSSWKPAGIINRREAESPDQNLSLP